MNGFPSKQPFQSIFQKDYLNFDAQQAKEYRGVILKKKELANASQIIVNIHHY